MLSVSSFLCSGAAFRVPSIMAGLALLLAFSQCRSQKAGTKRPTAKTTEPAGFQGFTRTPTGLYYKYFPKDGKADPSARKPKVGEFLTLHAEYRNQADSLLFSSRHEGQPIVVPVAQPTFKGGLEEAVMMLSPGDSGVFRINADSLFAKTFKQPMPPFIKPGTYMTFNMKALQLMTEEEMRSEQQRQRAEYERNAAARALMQGQKDEEIIKSYIKDKGLKATRTQSGLYYVITQPGKGPNAKAGQNVSVHYTGTTLDGKKFDSSRDRGQPFQFPLGKGQVIKGWDEGIALLNKGAKAMLIIPSTLAYGEQSPSPAIPPNSVLLFDVELMGME